MITEHFLIDELLTCEWSSVIGPLPLIDELVYENGLLLAPGQIQHDL